MRIIILSALGKNWDGWNNGRQNLLFFVECYFIISMWCCKYKILCVFFSFSAPQRVGTGKIKEVLSSCCTFPLTLLIFEWKYDWSKNALICILGALWGAVVLWRFPRQGGSQVHWHAIPTLTCALLPSSPTQVSEWKRQMGRGQYTRTTTPQHYLENNGKYLYSESVVILFIKGSTMLFHRF